MKIQATKEKVNEALKKISEIGHVSVSDNVGSFSAKGVEGRFSYQGDILTIVIDDKPWLASESMIENEIRKFFN